VIKVIQKKIVNMIEEYDTIIIHHHVNPDPDCIGSQLGLKYILQAAYPDKQIYAVGNHNERTKFLGEMDQIEDSIYQDALVIIVDVGDKARVDDQRFLNGKALIKIDHHPLTIQFADLEWVDTSYAAVTEMIVDLVIHNKEQLTLNSEAARVLYSGMLTDTGRFYYDSVTERTMRYASVLYAFDFDKQDLYAHLYYKSIDELKFVGHIQSHFEYTKNGLGYMKLNHETLERFQLDEEFASSMVNTLSNIKEVIMWIFFIEYKERQNIRVEFRSRGPIVNTFARRFNGGGHKWASGAIANNWNEVEQIVQEADLLCKEYFENK
jgi:bifunctional oligoribonuclease and PAP phosphatase NrnA